MLSAVGQPVQSQYLNSSRPRRMALATSCARSDASSFSYRCSMCVRIVLVASCSRRAIAGAARPSATSTRISISRADTSGRSRGRPHPDLLGEAELRVLAEGHAAGGGAPDRAPDLIGADRLGQHARRAVPRPHHMHRPDRRRRRAARLASATDRASPRRARDPHPARTACRRRARPSAPGDESRRASRDRRAPRPRAAGRCPVAPRGRRRRGTADAGRRRARRWGRSCPA